MKLRKFTPIAMTGIVLALAACSNTPATPAAFAIMNSGPPTHTQTAVECFDALAAEPEYASIQANVSGIPSYVSGSPTVAQLTNSAWPTPEEARLYGKMYDGSTACLAIGRARHPGYYVEDPAARETANLVAQGKLTWGQINQRNIANKASPMGGTTAPLREHGGTLLVSVVINDAIRLNFVLDTGAADVSVPADVVATLMRTGTINRNDFIGQQTYVLADGSRVPSMTFRIRSLKVGDKIAENVVGSVAASSGSLLLGQSFLRRFPHWSIDNQRMVLVLD